MLSLIWGFSNNVVTYGRARMCSGPKILGVPILMVLVICAWSQVSTVKYLKCFGRRIPFLFTVIDLRTQRIHDILCGSGSADPCLCLMDPDPAILSLTFKTPTKKDNKSKASQNSRNHGFSYYFCLMMEGSGSRRPKNLWIRNAGQYDSASTAC